MEKYTFCSNEPRSATERNYLAPTRSETCSNETKRRAEKRETKAEIGERERERERAEKRSVAECASRQIQWITLNMLYKGQSIRNARQNFSKNKGQGLGLSRQGKGQQNLAIV